MSGHRDPMESADVIIVGAGKAGSSAAVHLARAGMDVLLLEKSKVIRTSNRAAPRV